MKRLYINNLFFYLLVIVGALFAVSFFVSWLYWLSVAALALLVLALFVDIFILYSGKKRIDASRILPEKLSNGDENPIRITVKNNFAIPIHVQLIDEIPFQYQKRDFLIKSALTPRSKREFTYTLRPVNRGEYVFGKLNVYALTPLRLAIRRYVFCNAATVAAYPSFIQMQKYDLMAFSHNLFEYGVKKIRRIGHTMEFEQIREYVQGDDVRTINWKATSKKAQLMIYYTPI